MPTTHLKLSKTCKPKTVKLKEEEFGKLLMLRISFQEILLKLSKEITSQLILDS
jgi:hypothetical protein